MDANKSIYEYLFYCFGENQKSLQYEIERCGVQIICREFFKETDCKFYYMALMQKIIQKKKNMLFEEEIRVFLNECQVKNLRPVFLKGLFLAKEIYIDNSERRSNDIDILILKEDIEMYESIFIKLGYLSDIPEGTYFKDKMKALTNKHISFYKVRDGINIIIEVHSTAINPPVTFNLSGEFQRDVCQRDVLNMHPWVFQTEVNIVFLCLHFIKHLPAEYFDALILKNVWRLNLSNLHDIALLINRKKEEINWIKVVQIAKQSKVVGFVLYVLKFVDDIYTNLISEKIFNMLKANLTEDFIAAGEYEYIGLGRFSILFSYFNRLILDRPLLYLLKGDIPENLNLIKYSIGFGNRNMFKINKKYKFSFYDIENIQANICFWYHKSGICIQLEIYNKPICFYEEEGNTFDKDGMEIIFVNRTNIIHRIFTISRMSDNIYITISSCNNEVQKASLLLKTKWKLETSQNVSIFKLNLDWEDIGIDKNMRGILPFNIAYLQSDILSGKIMSNHQIFSGRGSIWDIRNLGYLRK